MKNKNGKNKNYNDREEMTTSAVLSAGTTNQRKTIKMKPRCCGSVE